jgi:hypothetical protein
VSELEYTGLVFDYWGIRPVDEPACNGYHAKILPSGEKVFCYLFSGQKELRQKLGLDPKPGVDYGAPFYMFDFVGRA